MADKLKIYYEKFKINFYTYILNSICNTGNKLLKIFNVE